MTIYGEASAMTSDGNLILNCGDVQTIGIIELRFRKPADAQRHYCKTFEITIREIEPADVPLEMRNP